MGAFFVNIVGDRVGWGGVGGLISNAALTYFSLMTCKERDGYALFKNIIYDGKGGGGGGALTSNAVLIMLFDATCCLHSFLLFTRVSRGLASSNAF